MCRVARQRQLPSATPGTFIRPSFPMFSKSCNGVIASAAGDDHARRINSGAASRSLPPSHANFQISRRCDPATRQTIHGRWIVVSAGIDHGIGDIVVRKVVVCGAAIESELQDSCSRNLELVAQEPVRPA